MAANTKDAFDLPADYHSRWEKLAQYGIDRQHGQICRLALMYALTLRRGAAAESFQVQFVRQRVWKAEGSRDYHTERVSLLSDEIVRNLLTVVEATKDLPKPNFPVAPCGSASIEVWCHSLASRKLLPGGKGKTNFEALSEQFLIRPAFGKWAPNAIYLVSVAIFRNCFTFSTTTPEAHHILADQLGLKTFKMAPYIAHTYTMETPEATEATEATEGAAKCLGRVNRCIDQLVWLPDE